jgi:hypothetical protein
MKKGKRTQCYDASVKKGRKERGLNDASVKKGRKERGLYAMMHQ